LIYDIAAARKQPLVSSLPAHADEFFIQDPPKPHPPEYTTYSPVCDFPRLSMAPAVLTNVSGSSQSGPHPSYIQVAKPFLFHQQIQGQLVAIGTNVSREDTYRLQGIQWINDVRTALQL
jgi:CTD kinase subunit beta